MNGENSIQRARELVLLKKREDAKAAGKLQLAAYYDKQLRG